MAIGLRHGTVVHAHAAALYGSAPHITELILRTIWPLAAEWHDFQAIMNWPVWNPRWTPVARTLCTVAVAATISAALPSVPRLALDPNPLERWQSKPSDPLGTLIVSYAGQYGLEPALLKAVIKVESNFNPQAISPKGALGLMQLMPITAAALHVMDPFDPDENIRAGALLLRRLLDRFHGDLALALAAYHAGEGRVSQLAGLPPSPGTQQYVERVLSHYGGFLAGAPSTARKIPLWPDRRAARSQASALD
ncbi:MAG: lytic transglycosylase domain-containing protein [Nitrospiraceae bacterium]